MGETQDLETQQVLEASPGADEPCVPPFGVSQARISSINEVRRPGSAAVCACPAACPRS